MNNDAERNSADGFDRNNSSLCNSRQQHDPPSSACSQTTSSKGQNCNESFGSKKIAHENRSKLIQERREQEKLRLLNELKMSEEKAEKSRRLREEERSRKVSAVREREQHRIALAAERRRQIDEENRKKVPQTSEIPNLMSTSMMMTSSMMSPRMQLPSKSHGLKTTIYAFGSSTPRGLTFFANGQLRPKTSADNLNSTQQSNVSSPVHINLSKIRPTTALKSQNVGTKITSHMSASVYVPSTTTNSTVNRKASTLHMQSVTTSKTEDVPKKKIVEIRQATTTVSKISKNNKPAVLKAKNDSSAMSKSISNIAPPYSNVKSTDSVEKSRKISGDIETRTIDVSLPTNDPIKLIERIDNTPGGNAVDLKNSDIKETADLDMNNGSQTKKSVMTEEEAKASLAERRRLAREQVEREKEAERIRLEDERLAEEKEFRRQEEEELKLLRAAQLAERERFMEAQESQRQKIEEDRLKQEQDRIKILELDQKNKELADKADKEREEKMKQDEIDRSERKKKLDAIRRRTRVNQSAPNVVVLDSAPSPMTSSVSMTSSVAEMTSSIVDDQPMATCSTNHTSPAYFKGSSVKDIMNGRGVIADVAASNWSNGEKDDTANNNNSDNFNSVLAANSIYTRNIDGSIGKDESMTVLAPLAGITNGGSANVDDLINANQSIKSEEFSHVEKDHNTTASLHQQQINDQSKLIDF